MRNPFRRFRRHLPAEPVLLRMAFPDATEEQLQRGQQALDETTLAEVKAGKQITQAAIDEAARRLSEIFPKEQRLSDMPVNVDRSMIVPIDAPKKRDL